MKESAAVMKGPDAKRDVFHKSPARGTDRDADRPDIDTVADFSPLRDVILNVRRKEEHPSVDSISTEFVGLSHEDRVSSLQLLQQTHGNRYVQRLVSRAKPKLDEYSMGMRSQGLMKAALEPSFEPMGSGILQRKCDNCSGKEELLQRSAIGSAPETVPPIVHEVLRSPGLPLDPSTRAFMEPRFGRNFSQISVYPKLLASIQTKLIVNAPGDVYEQEADRVASQVMRMPASWPHCRGSCKDLHPKFLSADDSGRNTVPTAIHEVLRSPGRPLDEARKSFMTAGVGHHFSYVRVHTNAKATEAANALNARAFTVGQDIVFNKGTYRPETNDGKILLAHELTHVLQQGGFHDGAGQKTSISGLRVARQIDQSPAQSSKDRPLTSSFEGRERTLVQVHIVGHASPLWHSARSTSEADRRNAELSEARARAIRSEIRALIRKALPDHDLVFKYDYTPADPRAEPGSVIIGTESRGSTETLEEAGSSGRRANEPNMRRVDVMIDLSSFADITQVKEVEETHLAPDPAARDWAVKTRDWAVNVALTTQFTLGLGFGYSIFKLLNRKTNQEVTGHGFSIFGSLGGRVSSRLPKMVNKPIGASVTWIGYRNFTTKAPANFSDFDGVSFTIRTHSIGVGFFGLEYAELSFLRLPGGDVSRIKIGGRTMGQFGLDLYSRSLGKLYLPQPPKGMYEVKSKVSQISKFESSSVEKYRHRVVFQTGESSIGSDEQGKLQIYVRNAIRNYQKGQYRFR